jgi:hypothetical protein
MGVLEGINEGIRTATGVMGFLEGREDRKQYKQQRADNLAYQRERQNRIDEQNHRRNELEMLFKQDQIRRGRNDEVKAHQVNLYGAMLEQLAGLQPSDPQSLLESFNVVNHDVINRGEGGKSKRVSNVFPLLNPKDNTPVLDENGMEQFGLELEIEREDGTSYKAPMDMERSVSGDNLVTFNERDILNLTRSLEASLMANGEEATVDQMKSVLRARIRAAGGDPSAYDSQRNAFVEEMLKQRQKHLNQMTQISARGDEQRKTADHKATIDRDQLPREFKVVAELVKRGWTEDDAIDATIRKNDKGRSEQETVRFWFKELQKREEALMNQLRTGEPYQPKSFEDLQKEAETLAGINSEDSAGNGAASSTGSNGAFNAAGFLDGMGVKN